MLSLLVVLEAVVAKISNNALMSLSKAADDRNDPSIGSVIVQIPTEIVVGFGKGRRLP